MAIVVDVVGNWTQMKGRDPIEKQINALISSVIVGSEAPDNAGLEYAQNLYAIWDAGITGLDYYLCAKAYLYAMLAGMLAGMPEVYDLIPTLAMGILSFVSHTGIS